MLCLSNITNTYYDDKECVFFRNPIQSAFYVFRQAELKDLFVDNNLKFVFVFSKEDHSRLKLEWKNREH